jgi:CheY-like chemotaxis protein
MSAPNPEADKDEPAATARPRRGPPLCILLAEDNPINEDLALRMLGRLGYSADVAHNGFEAVEAVARQHYDVILMDVQMPGLDGLEACRRIRATLPTECQPRIIAMTANALLGDRELCLRAGMDDYLSKPVSSQALLQALIGGPQSAPAPTPPVVASTADFDPAALRRLSDNLGAAADMVLPTLIRAFFEEAGRLVEALAEGLATGDLGTAHRLAHTLKSHGATFGGRALEQSCRALEASAKAGEHEQACRQLPEVQRAYALLSAALEAALLDSASS